MHIEPLARLIAEFSRIPTVGPKTAQRFAFYILKASKEEVKALADAIIYAKEKIGTCPICFGITDRAPCFICSDAKRNGSLLCVVAEPRDILAMERTDYFRGKYHVLGGTISPMDGIGPEDLRIEPLLERIERESISEAIIATNPSVTGDVTALYLAKLLKPKLRVTRLAFGLPIGADLEYADELTLTRAMEGRREL